MAMEKNTVNFKNNVKNKQYDEHENVKQLYGEFADSIVLLANFQEGMLQILIFKTDFFGLLYI